MMAQRKRFTICFLEVRKGCCVMKTYTTLPEAAVKWGVSAQAVRSSCEKQHISHIVCIRNRWFIPEDAPMPWELMYLSFRKDIVQ